MAENAIVLPRLVSPSNSTPEQDRTSLGPQEYTWDDGFIARSAEQSRVVDESVALLDTWVYHGGHILQAPTGFGKT